MEKYKQIFKETWKDAHLKMFQPVTPYKTNFAEIFISTSKVDKISKSNLCESGKTGNYYYYIYLVNDKRYPDMVYDEPFKYMNSIDEYWSVRYDLDTMELFSPTDFFTQRTPKDVKSIMNKLISRVSK